MNAEVSRFTVRLAPQLQASAILIFAIRATHQPGPSRLTVVEMENAQLRARVAELESSERLRVARIHRADFLESVTIRVVDNRHKFERAPRIVITQTQTYVSNRLGRSN